MTPFGGDDDLLFLRPFLAAKVARLLGAGFFAGAFDAGALALGRCDFEAGVAGLVDLRRAERVREVMIGWQLPARWEATDR